MRDGETATLSVYKYTSLSVVPVAEILSQHRENWCLGKKPPDFEPLVRMSLLGLKRILDQKFNPPKAAKDSLAGKTILITGATSGLGLAAAKHLVALNPDKLIITARNESKGQAAKKEIEDWIKTRPRNASAKSTEIVPMVLSMSSFAGVQEFANNLKKRFPDGIDGAILNAGMMNAKNVPTTDGWEETLQVNALSTFLLGLLVLPLLISAADSAKNSNFKPHLTIVSSGTAWLVKPDQMTDFMASETPLDDLSQPKNFPGGLAGGATQYGRSKLILEYAIRRLAPSPALKGTDGKPKVIINTVCPGMCKSDLGRDLGKGNPFIKFLTWLVFAFVARSAEDGANSYTKAMECGEETHGEMWKNDRVFEVGPMLSTDEGKKFGEKIWPQIVQVMVKADASTKTFIS